MARQDRSSTTGQLKGIREEVEIWRLTRSKRSPMPEDLWARATKLARRLGVWPVAHAAGLSYESLKRRVEEGASGAEARPSFVEMRGADLLATSAETGPVVELSGADGTRMTIRMASGSQVDSAALVGVFLGRGRS
jgi:hypothetical protein